MPVPLPIREILVHAWFELLLRGRVQGPSGVNDTGCATDPFRQ